MKKTLQDQYLLIKEGKGHKGVFLKEAKSQFPDIVRNAATFEEAAASLKTKNIINENIIGLEPINELPTPKKQNFELAFESFLAEAKKKKDEDESVKAEEKKVSKKVEEDLDKMHDNSDEKNPDNMIFDQIMMGYYAEMKDPKNADKTMQELKDIVLKNLSKDPIHYTKDGQFGVKGLGYVTEAPGLGEPKEAKGKYKASGYGDLNESKQPLNEEESKLRKVIREIIDNELNETTPITLKESVEKDLAAINKEAEHEVLQSKMEKIQALIDKKQSQLSKLDEDEDMKSLTDDKKVKEISKDIKALEKAKAKLERISGKIKGVKKEVLDEVEEVELDQNIINGITSQYNNIYEKNGTVTDRDIEDIAEEFPFELKSIIIDYLNGYDPGLEYDI